MQHARLGVQVTAQRLVERGLRAHASRTALIAGERRITYAELDQRSARLANALRAYGAGGARPAAVWTSSRPEYLELDVACTRSGIVRVGIGDRLTPGEATYIVRHSQAAILVVDCGLLEKLEPEALEGLQAVLVLDDGGAARVPSDRRFVRYETALTDARAELTREDVTGETPNYILYTSGTTGRPKGATHSHAARAASTLNMLASELRGLDSSSVFVHAAPLTHGSGSKLITMMVTGGASALVPRFDPELFARTLKDVRGTHTFGVPVMLKRLIEAGPGVVAAVGAMRQISFGGAPIAPALFRGAVEAFGPILTQIYGTSELPHPVTVLHPDDYESLDDDVLASAGRAAHGVDIVVVDDHGHEVECGTHGELLVRSPHAMSGYWRDPDATAEAFTPDGWYRTGDVARIGGDGLVTFQDRKRDLIISGGFNVYPSEVERVLCEHPAVRDVAVVGAPDDEWGEIVVAYVVRTNANVGEDELIQWSRTQLAGYKKPRVVHFVTQLPVSSTGKVLKRELRDSLWQGASRQVG